MPQLRIWLHDYRRDEEQKRSGEEKGTQHMLGHDVQGDDMEGFNPESFDLSRVKRIVQSRT